MAHGDTRRRVRTGATAGSRARARPRGRSMSSTARRAGLSFAAAALALAGAVYGVTRPASADVAAQLTAPQLVADMGAGWNLGNQLEANSNGIPSETAWGNPVITQALINRV